MALPATDTFTAADGTALQTYNASWSINCGAFAINTNAVYPNSVGAECGAGWNADTFDNAQYAQGVLAAEVSVCIGPAVRVASDGTSDTYYGYYNGTYLFKQVTGSWAQLGSNGSNWSVGDVIRLEADGTTITPKINGVTDSAIGARTDTAIASGRAGICGWSVNTGDRLDTWEGGNLSAAVAFQPRPPAAIDSMFVY